MSTMRTRRKFTPEFKAEAVKLVRASGKSICAVARELDLTANSLRDWVLKADIDNGRGPAGALTTSEREEVVKLRRELRHVTMERDFLKKAAAFFAKESQ